MILSGNEILREQQLGRIKISPFVEQNLTTNSYNLSLGSKLLRYTGTILDPKIENPFEVFDIPISGFVMQAGDFLLGSTTEAFGSDFFVPLIHGRSGVARMGLFVHVTADLYDIGAYGNSTLQLYATLPIRIHTGMQIAQASFWTVEGEIDLYEGKYKSTEAPTPSLIYKDYDTDQA